MDEDQDLGERDNQEPDDFPPGERVIHTQGYDLSINTLKEQWDDQTLLLPDFQREYVWDNPKASRLIESLLLNIPVPVLYFAETPEAKYEIVDGHQRIYSIVRYLDNQFALSGLRISQEFKGKRYHHLPAREQRFLKTRALRTIIISHDSSPSMKFEVFERLNTGGLALNAQEVRNALYRGPLNDLLKELESDAAFRSSLGTKRPRRRMVDRELILRFLALRDKLGEYKTPLVRFLNDYMRSPEAKNPQWIDDRREIFKSTIEAVDQVFGSAAFRVLDAMGTPSERNVNRALFDAQMVAFSYADMDDLTSRRDDVRLALAALFEEERFQNAIRRATGDRARIRERIGDVAGALSDLDISVSPQLTTALTKLSSES